MCHSPAGLGEFAAVAPDRLPLCPPDAVALDCELFGEVLEQAGRSRHAAKTTRRARVTSDITLGTKQGMFLFTSSPELPPQLFHQFINVGLLHQLARLRTLPVIGRHAEVIRDPAQHPQHHGHFLLREQVHLQF